MNLIQCYNTVLRIREVEVWLSSEIFKLQVFAHYRCVLTGVNILLLRLSKSVFYSHNEKRNYRGLSVKNICMNFIQCQNTVLRIPVVEMWLSPEIFNLYLYYRCVLHNLRSLDLFCERDIKRKVCVKMNMAQDPNQKL